MVANSTSLLTEHTDAVGLVDHNRAVVLVLQLNDCRQIGQVALHREHAVDDNQLDCLLRQALQDALQVGHVVVLIMQLAGKRKTTAVDNTCMVAVVANDVVALAHYHSQHALINREARREAKTIIFVDEF